MPRRNTGRRADYEWAAVGGAIIAGDLTLATKQNISLSTFLGPGTLMRSRGLIGGQLDTGAVEERVMIAMGIIIAQDTAIAAGSGSLPGPFTEGDAPWLWHGHLWLSSGAEAAVQDPALFQRLAVDSKAMRKVKASEGLVFVTEIAQVVDQAGTWDCQIGLRFLLAS